MKLPNALRFSRVQAEEQVFRFLRLFGFSLATQLVALNGHQTRAVVLSAIVGAAEVAFRQVAPALSTELNTLWHTVAKTTPTAPVGPNITALVTQVPAAQAPVTPTITPAP